MTMYLGMSKRQDLLNVVMNIASPSFDTVTVSFGEFLLLLLLLLLLPAAAVCISLMFQQSNAFIFGQCPLY